MSENNTCVLASSNQGKLKELTGALEPHNIHLVPQSDYQVSDAEETAVTFVENALIKARHASLATGLPALADDSGLVVPALNGDPGIYSARYALLADGAIVDEQAQADAVQKPSDSDNIQKLLHELRNHSGNQRIARFVCVLAYIERVDDPEPIIASGFWAGQIIETVDGDGGFGYDPVFYCPQTEMTAATMGKQRKAAISHRGMAIKSLQQQLQQRF